MGTGGIVAIIAAIVGGLLTLADKLLPSEMRELSKAIRVTLFAIGAFLIIGAGLYGLYALGHSQDQSLPKEAERGVDGFGNGRVDPPPAERGVRGSGEGHVTNTALDGIVQILCDQARLPFATAPSGLPGIQIRYPMDGGGYAMNFETVLPYPNQALKSDFGWVCKIENHGNKPLYSFTTIFNIKYIYPNGRKSVELPRPTRINELKAGPENAFTFYVWGQDNVSAIISMPLKFTAQKLGETQMQEGSFLPTNFQGIWTTAQPDMPLPSSPASAIPRVVPAPSLAASSAPPEMHKMGPINTENMIANTEEVMKRLSVLDDRSILVTSPTENSNTARDIRNLFNAGLYRLFSKPEHKGVSSKRLMLQPPNYAADVDAPKLPTSGATGIVVHGKGEIEDLVRQVLAHCYVVRGASKSVDILDKYYGRKVIWIELGSGAQWRAPEAVERAACDE
jgi:hypothetical protein